MCCPCGRQVSWEWPWCLTVLEQKNTGQNMNFEKFFHNFDLFIQLLIGKAGEKFNILWQWDLIKCVYVCVREIYWHLALSRLTIYITADYYYYYLDRWGVIALTVQSSFYGNKGFQTHALAKCACVNIMSWNSNFFQMDILHQD